MRKIRQLTAVISVLFCFIALAATTAGADPGEYNNLHYTNTIDRQFSFDCSNGVQVNEHFWGIENVRHQGSRQISRFKISGIISDERSGVSFKESQDYKIIFTEETVTFRGNIHTWHIPHGTVRQTGVRVYDIATGQLIKSHGRSDPNPNLCTALMGIQSRHK